MHNILRDSSLFKEGRCSRFFISFICKVYLRRTQNLITRLRFYGTFSPPPLSAICSTKLSHLRQQYFFKKAVSEKLRKGKVKTWFEYYFQFSPETFTKNITNIPIVTSETAKDYAKNLRKLQEKFNNIM